MENNKWLTRFGISLLLFFPLSQRVVCIDNIQPVSYYVDTSTGTKTGKGTLREPFSSLTEIASLILNPGDTVFLASGLTFAGSLVLNNVHGTESMPVVITTFYPENKKTEAARIDAKGSSCGVLLTNCSYVKVENLIITANGGQTTYDNGENMTMRCGILVTTTRSGVYGHVVLSGLKIRDVFFEEKGFVRNAEEVRTANGTQHYGWGIRFINEREDASLENLQVLNCEVKNTEHTGIKFTAINKSIKNIRVQDNLVTKTGGPGIQMSGVNGGIVKNNVVDSSGSCDDGRKWGRGSGLWTWSTSDVLIEKNRFLNANGPGDSAGAHIDYNCRNIILQYNFSANNAGGFCEILGNNYNCAYRYNISVNDGYRIKGKDGAFQEGKIFWLSGYVGKDNPRGPFNSYFYNNTIYVKKDIVARFAIAKTSEGICIANNMFIIEGESIEVEGDQYVVDKKGDADERRVFFENNLYLRVGSWPSSVLIHDAKPVYGNPEFHCAGGLALTDYIPSNESLIRDKGTEIKPIAGDTIGLTIGLKVEKDILGNDILGKPDIGAIEM